MDKASIWFSILTSGPEENFGVTEPPLVVHLLDGLEDDLCSRLEVRGCRVHLDYSLLLSITIIIICLSLLLSLLLLSSIIIIIIIYLLLLLLLFYF